MSIDAFELRDAIEDVLSEQASLDRVAAAAERGSWIFEELRGTASALGWFSLAAPEEANGLAVDGLSMLPIHSLVGQSLVSFPLLAHTLCTRALTLAQTNHPMLARLATGEIVGAAALPSSDARATLTQEGSRHLLRGEVKFILDSADADVLVLPASRGTELVLLLIPTNAAGVARKTENFADETRRIASVTFNEVVVEEQSILAAGTSAREIAEALQIEAWLGIAADSIGGAKSIFSITLEYLKTRQQFGRVIGSFQALKHRCADLQVEISAAEALLKHATAQVANKTADAADWAFMAKGRCARTYHHAAAEAVQMHGGIGFTWESHCHRFLKRAMLNEKLLGSPEDAAMQLASALCGAPMAATCA